jgi:hypothetical protein
MKIAVTKTYCIQTGEDTFSDRRLTRVFETSATFDDVIKWFLEKTPWGDQKGFFQINEIQFSMANEEAQGENGK